jgi:secondary thiamine-phosphate synthase enzyme
MALRTPEKDMAFEIASTHLSLNTAGNAEVNDITQQVAETVRATGIRDGQVLVFVPGSTGAVTTIEYESGVVKDLLEAIEELAPVGKYYRHDDRWGDGNGYAHVRAALLGPSLTVPVNGGRLMLGTWQQIVFIDFDNRPRSRRILVQVSGVK